MKFLADMGISPKTVAFLRTLGHDATHLQEQGLERLPDSVILAKARAEARILLTHDLGFGELVAASGARLPSVILFRLRNMQPDHANRYLNLVLSRHPTELAEGVVISVTEAQIRLRTLPVGPLF
jgi:predicted nuclease of predicted toxin-antitoxin system